MTLGQAKPPQVGMGPGPEQGVIDLLCQLELEVEVLLSGVKMAHALLDATGSPMQPRGERGEGRPGHGSCEMGHGR